VRPRTSYPDLYGTGSGLGRFHTLSKQLKPWTIDMYGENQHYLHATNPRYSGSIEDYLRRGRYRVTSFLPVERRGAITMPRLPTKMTGEPLFLRVHFLMRVEQCKT
jgi:hypothetical protein